MIAGREVEVFVELITKGFQRLAIAVGVLFLTAVALVGMVLYLLVTR